ncbi:MBL fold metallo-hydrolase [Xylanibacillus composti]|uniref:Hydroxyacylglutathione hydrolase n=1 Tax=Xylanibacillus composti TaxID=1572762 RepID=A0A8J4H563_9BACL|nr:MBL fold metallo-hydrolase [Xylanibacillus composti]GIQ71024.1 hydroxyacylglutathione hydrolase [Xylanibacillus composti]
MLSIETFTLGPLATNAYLLTNEEGRGIIIDPGVEPAALLKRIEKVDIEAIVLTHAHFDHIGGVEAVRKQKQCPVYVHAAEADWLTDPKRNGSLLWPEIGGPIQCAPAEFELHHGQQLNLLGTSFAVYHTPGHSPGSVSLLHEDKLFSGDVLFMMSVGRTDLPGGSTKELYSSIHDILFKLDEKTEVFPGHGPATTIGYEREHNPYV